MCVCVLVVCLLHSLIFTICLETRKRPVIPQHFVTWRSCTGIVLTAADRISDSNKEIVGQQERKIAILHIHAHARVQQGQFQVSVTGQKVDNCCAIYSNHLLICCCRELWGCCAVNLVINTALSGPTIHFINKTIFLDWPIAPMWRFAAFTGWTTLKQHKVFYIILENAHRLLLLIGSTWNNTNHL